MKAQIICTVKGTAAFDAPDSTCLNVEVGSYYVITKQADPAWWCGRKIENGLVSGSVGLLPSDHVVLVGQGLVLPGLEPLSGPRRSKKKSSKRSHSSSTLTKKKESSSTAESSVPATSSAPPATATPPATASAPPPSVNAEALASAQVFATVLAEKQAEMDLLSRKLDKMTKRNARLKTELTDSKKREAELRGQLSAIGKNCLRCGSELGTEKDVAVQGANHQQTQDGDGGGDDDKGIELLVSQGYNLDVLMRFKSVMRSVVMRRRFRKVAMDFKSHKSSLVMRLRNESLREILTSEQKYVDSLQMAVDEFQRPMLRLASGKQSGRVLQRSDVSDIFSTLEIIVELNRGLLNDLKERLLRWPSVQRFGDLFLRMGPILRLYSSYIRNFDVAQRTLQDRREHNSAFVEFVEECEKRAGGQHLESFLIMPVQRLPRYQMLLNGLLKYTDPMHVDYSDINLAHTRMIEICQEVNFQKSMDDNAKAVRLLFEEVDGLVDALSSLCTNTGSYFIHRGDLHSIMGASFDNYYCLLFSNGLVRAVPTRKKAPAWAVVDVVPLHSISGAREIPDMSGIANGFEISVTRFRGEGFVVEKKDVIAMCAPTTPDKSMWLTKIGGYLERWQGGEDGARQLHESIMKLLDDARDQQGSAGRAAMTASGFATPTPQRLLSKGMLRQSAVGRSSTVKDLHQGSK